MRRLLSFSCQGSRLGASVDGADGTTGVLIVTGGTQTRIGSHRLFERLAAALARSGYPCFRFDRRGIGDSEGDDPGFRGNSADIACAAVCFRSEIPKIERLIGLGLCDGAASLAMFSSMVGLDGMVMVNPWLVEAEANAPAPAAIKRHYRKQLLSVEGWRKIATGAISYRKLLAGVRKISSAPREQGLAIEVAQGLNRAGNPVELILARNDATAIAADDAWSSAPFRDALGSVAVRTTYIETDAHTFSRPGDFQVLLDTSLAAIGRLAGSGGD